MKLLLLALICGLAALASAKTGTVHVNGFLRCKGVNLYKQKVAIKERDSVDPDDTLNSTLTSFDGSFELWGTESELGKIEPYLYIAHNCTKDGKEKELKYDIPQEYIKYGDSKDPQPTVTFKIDLIKYKA